MPLVAANIMISLMVGSASEAQAAERQSHQPDAARAYARR